MDRIFTVFLILFSSVLPLKGQHYLSILLPGHAAFEKGEQVAFVAPNLFPSGTISSAGQSSPELSIYPNPFSEETTIDFTLNKSGHVDITIFNVLGKEIKKIKSGELERGNYKLLWNGRDNQNLRLPEGMYICKMVTDGKTLTKAIYYLREGN